MAMSFNWFKLHVDKILDKERSGSSSSQFTIPREHVVRLDNREIVNLAHNDRVVFVEFANGEISRYSREVEKDWKLYSNARVI